ncbi:MAG: hypothetical protein KO463_04385 [Candidatus Methanofastidiosa archaeon]|nr:hypothetical protein [Candidatus Methanofastidiosa archaeon]
MIHRYALPVIPLVSGCITSSDSTVSDTPETRACRYSEPEHRRRLAQRNI